ncbi:unnamed protein product, partial [Allacma fusca]
MIHRDLKPVNIFLDSNDHVKTEILGSPQQIFRARVLATTRCVYVAQELVTTGTKALYNQ